MQYHRRSQHTYVAHVIFLSGMIRCLIRGLIDLREYKYGNKSKWINIFQCVNNGSEGFSTAAFQAFDEVQCLIGFVS